MCVGKTLRQLGSTLLDLIKVSAKGRELFSLSFPAWHLPKVLILQSASARAGADRTFSDQYLGQVPGGQQMKKRERSQGLLRLVFLSCWLQIGPRGWCTVHTCRIQHIPPHSTVLSMDTHPHHYTFTCARPAAIFPCPSRLLDPHIPARCKNLYTASLCVVGLAALWIVLVTKCVSCVMCVVVFCISMPIPADAPIAQNAASAQLNATTSSPSATVPTHLQALI